CRGLIPLSRSDGFSQLDPGDEAALPDFGNGGEISKFFEFKAHLFDLLLQRFQDPLLAEDFEAGLGSSASQGVSGVAMTLSQRFSIRNRSVEPRKDFFRG